MLELGKDSPALHSMVGSFAGECADLVISCGNMSKNTADAAAAKTKAVHFAEKQELINALPELIERGDRVLVKASRGMRFEDISEALMQL